MNRLSIASLLILILSLAAFAQSLGTAGTISGTLIDPNNAVVAGATLILSNTLTGYSRTVTSDSEGNYRFNDVPQNNYNLRVTAAGFRSVMQAVNIRSSVPVQLPLALSLAESTATVDVSSDAVIVENTSTTHTDVDQIQLRKLPLSSPGNGLSDAIVLTSPGVVSDSNGFIHPLGDHSQVQFTIDNQPITDQQTKAFSSQLPVNAIQSLEVITGATPAEYGDKTSLVVNTTTKSGLNHKKPFGSFNSSYGTFNSIQEEGTVGFGGKKFGNFSAFNFERSNRFLDAPEFVSFHNNGNSTGFFNRFDYSPTTKDSFHLNLFLARNKFQIANTYEQNALGQDQRQSVKSINIAPGYVRIFSSSTVLTVNPFYRRDVVEYSPSSNPFSDQTVTTSQRRTLANAGFRADVSYVHGINNIKVGGQYQRTYLNEGFQFGITDPHFNNPASPNFLPGLLPFDLTRGGRRFVFNGNAVIKQQAAYIQDSLDFKNGLSVSLGLRFDNYDGISKGKSFQPRLGVSYLLKRTNTVFRASYTRNFETPYNENLVLSSATGNDGFAGGLLGDTAASVLKPGNRNQVNFGIQQGIGKYIVADLDYFNKRTTNAYDFNVILNTPITFPISWKNSKIDGVSFRLNLANYKGVTASFNAGHNRARFFPPESGGLFFNSNLPTGVFRIDHDQVFQQTTQVQYSFDRFKSFHKFEPFVAFTWRYDSGVVSGAVPDYATALAFTGDEQQQIGLFCGSTFATLASPIRSCSSTNRGALRLRIPADGKENDDTNPPRIAPRNLFDLSLGSDNVMRSDKFKISAHVTFVNITNKESLYNFESTFSGTHFVSPRTIRGTIGITF